MRASAFAAPQRGAAHARQERKTREAQDSID